jgi:chaperone required for assembly of F1-ATPase
MKWKPLLDYVRNELGLVISKETPVDLVEHMERQEEIVSNLNKINKELKKKLETAIWMEVKYPDI